MTDPRPSPLEPLIQDHAAFLGRLARSLVGDRERASDLVQETWAAALTNPGALRSIQSQSGDSTRGWLATILRRRSFSGRRRASLRRTDPLNAEQASDDPHPDATVTRWERQRLVQEALHGLPEPYRTTLILRFQDELSAAEIGARTGHPASTVRSQMARGLERLRKVLDHQHPGGRAEWLSALLPLGWPGMALPGSNVGSATSLLSPSASATTAALMKNSTLAISIAALVALVVVKPWTAWTADKPGGSAELTHSQSLVNLEPLVGDEDSGSSIAITLEGSEATRQPIESMDPSEAEQEASPASVALTATPQTASPASPFLLSGRALLLDGTPISNQRIDAKSQLAGADDFAYATTDGDGRFEIAMNSKGPHRLNLMGHHTVQGLFLADVAAPTMDIEFRVDAIVFRAHLPRDLDLSLFPAGGVHSVFAYGVEALPFRSMTRFGFHPKSVDEITQELLPTGPGYCCLAQSASQELVALVPPGAAAGVYDIDFVTESPELASVQVALTGVPISDPSYVTVSLGWLQQGDSSVTYAQRLGADQATCRSDVLIPGEYEVTTRVFSPPPRGWSVPKALTPSLTLEAGEVAFIEVELSEGGGLELVFSCNEEIPPQGLLLETWDEEAKRWCMHLTSIPNEDDGLSIGPIHTPDIPYTSWQPLPTGEVRVRLSAKGFRPVEEALYIKAAALTKWAPRIEGLPVDPPP